MGIRRIGLSDGSYAVVDDLDYDLVSNVNWSKHSQGYAYSSKYLMHRLINNTPNGMDTDHINRDKLDNRRNNLRSVSRSQNMHNVGIVKSNKSGFRGVSFDKWTRSSKKWRATLKIEGKQLHLGRYYTAEEAYQVYREARKGLVL